MIKKHKKLIAFVCLTIVLALPQIILAANPALNTLDNVASGDKGPYAQPDASVSLSSIIGTVAGIALGLIGIVFLILMILAGYNWMTAEGQEEKVTKARETIIRALIGIIIVVGAYAIWQFIFKRLI